MTASVLSVLRDRNSFFRAMQSNSSLLMKFLRGSMSRISIFAFYSEYYLTLKGNGNQSLNLLQGCLFTFLTGF